MQPTFFIGIVLSIGEKRNKMCQRKGAVAFVLQQMVEAFVVYCQAKKLREKTIAAYEQTLKLCA